MGLHIHKAQPGMVDPYWRIDSVFKDLKVFLPLLEGAGLVTRDYHRNSNQSIGGRPWLSGEHGPEFSTVAGTSISTGIASSTYNFATGATFLYWASTTNVASANRWLSFIYINDDNFLKFGRNSSGNWFTEYKADTNYGAGSVAAPGITDGKMHLFVLSFGPSGVYGYFDKQEMYSAGAVNAGVWNSTSFPIGSNGSEAWIGNIGVVARYDRALTAEDVYTIYDLGPSMGLNSNNEINPAIYGAIQGSSTPAFNAAWTLNSNQVL